jgi:chemosensory pili system protein ChpA (sensor histidine kinase/response regulator)
VQLQILYDGSYPPCVQEIAFWRQRSHVRGLAPDSLLFINVQSLEAVQTFQGDGMPEVYQTMVGVLSTGTVLRDQALFLYLEQTLGLGVLHQASRWPVLGGLLRGWHQTWLAEHLPCTGRWAWHMAQIWGNDEVLPQAPDSPDQEEENWRNLWQDHEAMETRETREVSSHVVPLESLEPLESPEPSAFDPQSSLLEDLLADLEPAILEPAILEPVDLEPVDLEPVALEDSPDQVSLEHLDILENFEDLENFGNGAGDKPNEEHKEHEDYNFIDLDLLDLELEGWETQSGQEMPQILVGVDTLDEPLPTELSELQTLDSLLKEIDSPSSAADNLLLPSPARSEPEVTGDFYGMDTFIESSAGTVGMPIVNVWQNRDQSIKRPDQTMKVSVRQLDTLGNLIAEMVVSRNCMEEEHERLRQFLNNLLYQMQQLSYLGQRFQELYDRSLLESALASNRHSFNRAKRTDSEPFDALEMDHFTEFHQLSQEMIELVVRARESASDIDYVINEPLDYIARHFRQVTTQVQEGINRTRMVPFEQGTIRLPRAIREVASRTGKEARLVVEGKETLVDKVLLEQLYDPLTHLVNNAVIHGIEPPKEREHSGKAPWGNITIQAFYQGNQTVIIVKDDGAGIDADRIRHKALQRGLINLMQAQTLKDIQMFDFIFHPGFSTRDHADNFAGRGVGMDVVKTKIENLRGTISVDSVRGQGTRFTIRLPLTLSITKALCCISDGAMIAIPMDSVEDVLDIHEHEVYHERNRGSYISWKQEEVPLKPLSELLHYNRTRSHFYRGHTTEEELMSIIILRTTEKHFAIQVDWVEGEKQIVIKQLEGPINKPHGITGVTVLSDGQILPIVDVLELVEIAQGRFYQPVNVWKPAPPKITPLPDKYQPVVLIVDDSVTVRELLSMTFKKGNYRVEQARDGREAWEKLRAGLPCDLIFCDIEMPRMTGLELLEKLQRDPILRQIPIAMLTSRGADRHRQMATQLGAKAYFTKPYLEEMLLEAAQRMIQKN